MLFTPRTLCLRHLDQKQHLQRSSWKCYTANSPRLLKLDDGSHQGADLACRFGLEETNVLMVHICNQRGIQVYCSIQTCQYLYRFYFRMLAPPPPKHWADSQPCGHSSIFAASAPHRPPAASPSPHRRWQLGHTRSPAKMTCAMCHGPCAILDH